MENKIYVTKSFLPPIDEYNYYLNKIWENNTLTNQGPLLREFEEKIAAYLNVRYFHFLVNGTASLQLALDTLDLKDGDIITTPFSYVATTTSILWERCRPVFVDIEPDNFCIDASKIEEAITPNTKAILAVHVFGYACDVEKINNLAEKYNLKVIYDGAHAFGSIFKKRSLLSYGDITTCSFHATKLFHTVEGGACIVKDKRNSDKLELSKRFGHDYDKFLHIGINGKNSEFHAAMGLANLKYLQKNIKERKEISMMYDELLGNLVVKPKMQKDLEYNYSYYPVLFKNENQLISVCKALNSKDIYPRRYFYPSLNKLPYLPENKKCPISEDISSRIVCLPLYSDLKTEDVQRICEIIKKSL